MEEEGEAWMGLSVEHDGLEVLWEGEEEEEEEGMEEVVVLVTRRSVTILIGWQRSDSLEGETVVVIVSVRRSLISISAAAAVGLPIFVTVVDSIMFDTTCDEY